jgi:hypothetical protein
VPDILIIGLERFESETIDGRYTANKKQDCVTPSKKITVNNNDLDLTLKAVSEHHGTGVKGGHYTTSFRKNNDKWIKICDISKDSHIVTDTTPLDGYLFLYEKPDKGNSDLDHLPNANSGNINIGNTLPKKRTRVPSPKSPTVIPVKVAPKEPSSKENSFFTSKDSSQNCTSNIPLSKNDPSLDFTKLSRNELIEMILLENCKASSKSDDNQLRERLKSIFAKKHPIHDYLTDKNIFSNLVIKELAQKLNIKLVKQMQRLRNSIAKHFIEHWSKFPMN